MFDERSLFDIDKQSKKSDDGTGGIGDVEADFDDEHGGVLTEVGEGDVLRSGKGLVRLPCRR